MTNVPPEPGDMTAGERDRWRRVIQLFELPKNRAESELYGFLSRWLLPASLAVLEDVVRRSNSRACASWRGLVVDVAEQLRTVHPAGEQEWVYTALPLDLAHRIKEVTR